MSSRCILIHLLVWMYLLKKFLIYVHIFRFYRLSNWEKSAIIVSKSFYQQKQKSYLYQEAEELWRYYFLMKAWLKFIFLLFFSFWVIHYYSHFCYQHPLFRLFFENDKNCLFSTVSIQNLIFLSLIKWSTKIFSSSNF